MAEVAGGLRGLFGGFAVEGLELYTELRRYCRWPEATATSRHWKVPERGQQATRLPKRPAFSSVLDQPGLRLRPDKSPGH